jgi:hypothetical protein
MYIYIYILLHCQIIYKIKNKKIMKKIFFLIVSILFIQSIYASNKPLPKCEFANLVKELKLKESKKPLSHDCTMRVCRTVNVQEQTTGGSGGVITASNTTNGSYQCCSTITAGSCDAANGLASALSQNCANQLAANFNLIQH